MIELFRKAIEALKNRVNFNLKEIKLNETKFRSILTEEDTRNRQDELNKILETNKNLLSENFDFINVQVTLYKFLEKYRYHEIFQDSLQIENKNIDEQEVIKYFEYTVNGKLPYTSDHPLYNDINFFKKLIKYYEDREEYEKCAEIMNTKNSSII